MTGKQVRQQFLDFFASKKHEIVESSPVVPHDDPTLMFTNAGMNQFKDVFLGTGTRPYKRAANTQKCIRAGGKHNDLDDVGRDTYHHTFFEMLGNWSFGDYFKKEAIEWAWELLTDVWGIEKDRLYATYFEGDEADGMEPDSETAELWRTVTDIDPAHIHGGNKKDNFWEMGDTGPCGPCSEIHVDLTPDKSGASLVNAGDPRVIELWNLVFIQFNRDAAGKLTPLPAKHVDTGMGLERLVAMLWGKADGLIGAVSNYDTDVFTPIFDAIQKRTGAPAYCATLPTEPQALACANERTPMAPSESESSRTLDAPTETESSRGSDAPTESESSRRLKPAAQGDSPPPFAKGGTQGGVGSEGATTQPQVMIDVSYRVIADHLRCLTFALTDGAIPSNEGRGYVLRRILRRAVRYGRQYMNMHEPFLCDLVTPLVDHLAGAFPELRSAHGGKNVEHISEIIRDEEAAFVRTLDRGIKLFNRAAMRAVYRALRPGIEVFGPLPPAGYVGSRAIVKTDDVFSGEPDQVFDIHGHYFSVASLTSNNIRSRLAKTPTITGQEAFQLHDTNGFPIDLTVLMAQEYGLGVDIQEYEQLVERARETSKGESAVEAAKRQQQEQLKQQQIRNLGKEHQERVDEDEEAKRREVEELRQQQIIDGAERQFTRQHQQFLEGLAPGACDDFPKYYQWKECKARRISFARNVGLYDTNSAKENEIIFFSTDRTCFYAEQGGQVSDVGSVSTETGEIEVRSVSRHSVRIRGRIVDLISHEGLVRQGEIWPFQECVMRVLEDRRIPTMKNHTSTHLLNWALREVLGDHVQQKGSLVDPEKTRFDFSHNKPVSAEELARIESLVNEKIEADLTVYTKEVDQTAAREINTLRAVFGEKYPDRVRVVSVGAPIGEEGVTDAITLLGNPKDPKWMQYSVEFCGGTHLKTSAKAERFVITTEEGVAKGIRRVVGVTGETAKKAVEIGNRLLVEADELQAVGGAHPTTKTLAGKPPVAPDGELASAVSSLQQLVNEADIPLSARQQLRERIATLQETVKKEEKQAASASGKAVMGAVGKLFESAKTAHGVTVVVGEVPPAGADALRGAIDWVRNKTEASAVFLVTCSDEKVTLIAGMSKSVVKQGVKAGDLIKEIAPIVGGSGGGRPDMAQGGGNDPSAIPQAIERAKMWLSEKL